MVSATTLVVTAPGPPVPRSGDSPWRSGGASVFAAKARIVSMKSSVRALFALRVASEHEHAFWCFTSEVEQRTGDPRSVRDPTRTGRR